MTPREHVIEALRLAETSVIPYTLYVDQQLGRKLGESFLDDCAAESFTVRVLWELRDRDFGDHFFDRFGVRWDRSRTGDYMYRGDFLPEPDARAIPEIKLIRQSDIANILELRRRYPDKFIYFQFATTLNGRLAAFRGMENYLMDLLLHADFVDAALEKLATMHLEAIEALTPLPIDAIVFGDDFGSQKGLMISRSLFKRFFQPVYNLVAEAIRGGGKALGVHCCGDATELMGDFVDMGVEFFHPLQPECMNIKEMKRQFGRRIAFRGGIGVQAAIAHGSATEARREVREAVSVLSRSGGYLMETVKPLDGNVPLENARAVIEEIRTLARKGS